MIGPGKVCLRISVCGSRSTPGPLTNLRTQLLAIALTAARTSAAPRALNRSARAARFTPAKLSPHFPPRDARKALLAITLAKLRWPKATAHCRLITCDQRRRLRACNIDIDLVES